MPASGVYIETSDPETGVTTEKKYHLPLPVRATRAMWRLRTQGIETFKDFNMRLMLPAEALA